ncbi:MAG: hypothetical protein ACKVYV_19265 [Limisphaerales bacterium]
MLKGNPRGRLLRRTKDFGDHQDHIIVSATGSVEFKRVLNNLIALPHKSPAKIA